MKGFKDTIRKSPIFRWSLVVSNWMFQGILHSDQTEKIYKILFSLIFSLLFIFILSSIFGLSLTYAVIIGVLLGHTLNWIVNSNFNNIIIHRLFISRLEKENAFNYLDSLSNRLDNHPSVLYATTHGSICNGELKPSSDIDVALVRKEGFINGIKALYFVVRERKIADLKGIPLEIYLSDTPDDAIVRFRDEQNPVVIYDPQNVVDHYYNAKLTISLARKLNGLQ